MFALSRFVLFVLIGLVQFMKEIKSLVRINFKGTPLSIQR